MHYFDLKGYRITKFFPRYFWKCPERALPVYGNKSLPWGLCSRASQRTQPFWGPCSQPRLQHTGVLSWWCQPWTCRMSKLHWNLGWREMGEEWPPFLTWLALYPLSSGQLGPCLACWPLLKMDWLVSLISDDHKPQKDTLTTWQASLGSLFFAFW